MLEGGSAGFVWSRAVVCSWREIGDDFVCKRL